MMETSKAMKRRSFESDRGEFPWKEIFGSGLILDVGAGDDPLIGELIVNFDLPDGGGR